MEVCKMQLKLENLQSKLFADRIQENKEDMEIYAEDEGYRDFFNMTTTQINEL